MYWTPGTDNSSLIKTEKAASGKPENREKKIYKNIMFLYLLHYLIRINVLLKKKNIINTNASAIKKISKGCSQSAKPLDIKSIIKILLNKSYEIWAHIGMIKSHILYH